MLAEHIHADWRLLLLLPPCSHVHDMVTFATVVEGAVRLEGQPETEHSWFPGYSWTITNCRLCSSHLVGACASSYVTHCTARI